MAAARAGGNVTNSFKVGDVKVGSGNKVTNSANNSNSQMNKTTAKGGKGGNATQMNTTTAKGGSSKATGGSSKANSKSQSKSQTGMSGGKMRMMMMKDKEKTGMMNNSGTGMMNNSGPSPSGRRRMMMFRAMAAVMPRNEE